MLGANPNLHKKIDKLLKFYNYKLKTYIYVFFCCRFIVVRLNKTNEILIVTMWA
jgi:hypothetical protein